MNNQSHKLMESASISGSSQNGATKSSKFAGTNAALWTTLSLIFLFQIITSLHPYLTLEISAIFAGIIVCIVASALITRKMLINLEKTGQVVTTLKTILVSLGAVVVIISVLLSIEFGDFSADIKNGFLISLGSGAPAFLLTRFLLMKNWESKNKKIIFQDKYRMYILPDPPVDNLVTQTAYTQTWQNNEKVA